MTRAAADPDRIEALLRDGDRVRRLALRLCADAHGVDDAVQDAWLAALRAPPQPGGRTRAWLAKVLRNGVRQAARAGRRRRARELAAGAAVARESAPPADVLVARAELHRRLVGLVVALPEPQRALVLQHYFEGREVAAIAAQRALSPDAVRAHLRRARVVLRQQLEDEPGHRRALLGLAAELGALPAAGVGATAALGTGIAMKQVLLGGAAVLAVAFGSWWALAWHQPDLATANVDVGGAAASAPRAAAPASSPADLRETAVRTALPADGAPAAGVPFAIELRGLHPDAPWTEKLHLQLEGRDDSRNEWLRQDATEPPGDDGVLRLQLPPWAADHVRELRVYADDPNYLPFDVRRDGALPETGVLGVDVQVVAVLQGRVVDAAGEPVPAARVTAFETADGVPCDGAVGQTNSAADGSYVLQVPPATPLFVVAAAMQETSVSGHRLVGLHGAVGDVGRFRGGLLPAGRTVTGSVGTCTAGIDFRLAAAVAIDGLVRWTDGRAIGEATVGAFSSERQQVLRLDQNALVCRCADGALRQMEQVAADADGAFRLWSTPGTELSVMLHGIPGVGNRSVVRLDRVVAPCTIALEVPLPVRLVALAEGRQVPSARWQIGDNSGAMGGGGEYRLVVSEPTQVIATTGPLRSAPVTIGPEHAGTTVAVPLRRELARVRVDFDGEFRVRNARFECTRLAEGTKTFESGFRDDRGGPFELWLEPGSYLLRAFDGPGERNGEFLLPQARRIEVSREGFELTLPATFGGILTVHALDGVGRTVTGACRVVDVAGHDHTDTFHIGEYGMQRRGAPGALLPGGPSTLDSILPPGDYDLLLDLGALGMHRRRVTVTAREILGAVVRIP